MYCMESISHEEILMNNNISVMDRRKGGSMWKTQNLHKEYSQLMKNVKLSLNLSLSHAQREIK